MATGRTTSKYLRVYVGGYDLSGHGRQIGPLRETYQEVAGASFADEVIGILNHQAQLGVGTLNGWFDNSAAGLQALHAAGPGLRHVVSVALGIRAAPAIGDPVYAGEFEQGEYLAIPAGGMVTAAVPFAAASAQSGTRLYDDPWGVLLLDAAARTGANADPGEDNPTGAATDFGGFMAYHILGGNGTATLKVQDAATNTDGSFADLTGATTGSVDCSTPQAGVVALARNATVRRYLRWQLALGTATSVSAVLSFHRALR